MLLMASYSRLKSHVLPKRELPDICHLQLVLFSDSRRLLLFLAHRYFWPCSPTFRTTGSQLTQQSQALETLRPNTNGSKRHADHAVEPRPPLGVDATAHQNCREGFLEHNHQDRARERCSSTSSGWSGEGWGVRGRDRDALHVDTSHSGPRQIAGEVPEDGGGGREAAFA